MKPRRARPRCDDGPSVPLEAYDDDAIGPLRSEANGQGILPRLEAFYEVRPHLEAPEPESGASEDDAPEEPLADPAQLELLPPSIARRRSVRRVRHFRYIDIRGEIHRKSLVETVPVVRPTSADDAGLPDVNRWTPPRHTKEFDTLPYEQDFAVRAFVRAHPEGASLEEIAEEIGWSKQGLLDVERRGLRKIVKLALEDDDARQWMADILGLDIDDVHDALDAWAPRKGRANQAPTPTMQPKARRIADAA